MRQVMDDSISSIVQNRDMLVSRSKTIEWTENEDEQQYINTSMQIPSFNLPLLGIDWSILVAVEVASTIATIFGYSEKKSRAIEHLDSFD
jgi:hypothetical protein